MSRLAYGGRALYVMPNPVLRTWGDCRLLLQSRLKFPEVEVKASPSEALTQ